MASEPSVIGAPTWRSELPALTGRVVTLREPTALDLGPLVDLLSIGDATRFGLEEPVTDVAVQQFIARIARERAAGVALPPAGPHPPARAPRRPFSGRHPDPGLSGAAW